MKRWFNIFWIFSLILIIPVICQAFDQWPDTGQTICYDDDGNEINPCPIPGEDFYGQDANYSRNPQFYKKLGTFGDELPDTASAADGWIMTRDNVTGLIWEIKTIDGSIHDIDKEFTWCDSNSSTNGGDTGVCGNSTSTEDFINTINAEDFGGFDDWRLPTIKELFTIVNSGTINPSINETFFKQLAWPSFYWSSTSDANDSESAWGINFDDGSIDYPYGKSISLHGIAVRGGQSGSLDTLVDNGDGTVTDTSTGLMWQQDTQELMNWESAITYCESLSLASYDDWRLPNRNELLSLVDYSKYNPAIDTVFFPDTVSSYYWSSTTDVDNSFGAWYVRFKYGNTGNLSKSYTNYVRAVRAGESVSLGNSDIWYKDSDNDGFGDLNILTTSTSQPTGYVLYNTDCNDNDLNIYPGAVEVVGDGIDQDCDGNDANPTWYRDFDGDGYGNPKDLIDLPTIPINGYVSDNTDCDDTDSNINPGNNNCYQWYHDSDGDSYGDPNDSTYNFSKPFGYVSDGLDCDDNDPTKYPGSSSYNNCSGWGPGSFVSPSPSPPWTSIDPYLDAISILILLDLEPTSVSPSTSQRIAIYLPYNNEIFYNDNYYENYFGSELVFVFNSIENAEKYVLSVNINDQINHSTSNIEIAFDMIQSYDFTELLTYSIQIDPSDDLLLKNIQFAIEAYDSNDTLIASTYDTSLSTKFTTRIMIQHIDAITLTSPTLGELLSPTNAAPTFQWNEHQEASTYTIILAHVGSSGFDSIVIEDNLTLNSFTMDDSTWQSMSTGEWYWAVIGYDATGNQTPSDFTIYDFNIQ